MSRYEDRPRDRFTGSSDANNIDDRPKIEPNYGLSGKLAAESNTKQGVVLKYQEPSDAAVPNVGWRLFIYEAKDERDMLIVSKQSAYLFGRDKLVADIPLHDSSCSKQHAVLQFRQSKKRTDYGEVRESVKPFIIDLESTNKTTVNGKEIPELRYYEIRSGDIVTFGDDPLDYVFLSEEGL